MHFPGGKTIIVLLLGTLSNQSGAKGPQMTRKSHAEACGENTESKPAWPEIDDDLLEYYSF